MAASLEKGLDKVHVPVLLQIGHPVDPLQCTIFLILLQSCKLNVLPVQGGCLSRFVFLWHRCHLPVCVGLKTYQASQALEQG